MHEVSLGQSIRDYLTGEQVDATTYEDLRQALARLLVEERGYPATALCPRVEVRFALPDAASGKLRGGVAVPESRRGSVPTGASQPSAVPSAGAASEDARIGEACRVVDFVAMGPDGRPLLAVLFCAGQVNTYLRESLAAARLLPGGPAPLVVVTDTRDALLVATESGTVQGEGMRAIPAWSDALALAAAHPSLALSAERRDAEARILHAYTGFLKTCCGESVCLL